MLEFAYLFCAFVKSALSIRPNDRNISTQHIVAALLGDMLGVAGSNLKVVNLNQQHPTRRNIVTKGTQHVTPNNVAMCCVENLRSFGLELKH